MAKQTANSDPCDGVKRKLSTPDEIYGFYQEIADSLQKALRADELDIRISTEGVGRNLQYRLGYELLRSDLVITLGDWMKLNCFMKDMGFEERIRFVEARWVESSKGNVALTT